MTVAVAEDSPWVETGGPAAPRGAEVELVEAFAEDLGVEILWRPLSASDALRSLESGEADLAVGGFTREEVNAYGTAAPSYAYFEEVLVVAARPEARIPETIRGETIYLPPDVVARKLVREHGGTPVRDPAEADLVALPHWEVAARGLVPSGVELERRRHVVAIPKGENAWLMRLETFLRENAAGMGDRLRERAR